MLLEWEGYSVIFCGVWVGLIFELLFPQILFLFGFLEYKKSESIAVIFLFGDLSFLKEEAKFSIVIFDLFSEKGLSCFW